jgi:hypothetical protein
MLEIYCSRFDIDPRLAGKVDRLVADNGGRYCDDPLGVVVSSVGEAVELLRWQPPDCTRFTGRFRIDDMPSLTVVWQQVACTAAIAYQLRNQQVELVHLILGGQDPADDAAAIEVARDVLGNSFPRGDISAGRSAGCVRHVALVLREIVSEEEPAALLGFIAIVPIFCVLCGIE